MAELCSLHLVRKSKLPSLHRWLQADDKEAMAKAMAMALAMARPKAMDSSTDVGLFHTIQLLWNRPE